MHQYDLALKNILNRRGTSVLRRAVGVEAVRFHNSELPEVRSRQADLIAECADGTLLHVELQSTNDARMAWRMLEYAVAIERAFGQFPRQLVLYVGEAPMRMASGMESAGVRFQCTMMDIRELESEVLLESGSLDDNIISILAHMTDPGRTVRRVLGRILECEAGHRDQALAELMILAGLRNLGQVIREETEKMPILNDIMDHDYLGPLLRKERATGWTEGRTEGRVEGERTVLLSLIRTRFGKVPEWLALRVESLGSAELESLAPRILNCSTPEELFG